MQLSPPDAAASLFWLLPASVAVAAAYALFMGALSLRTGGVYFIMVTLAFAQMAYYVVHDTPLGGGTDGIYLAAKPVAAIGATVLLDLDDAHGAVLLRARQRWWWSSSSWRCCCARPSGARWRGIRINEQRMRATGFSTYRYKLAAFVISGARGRAGRVSCSR